jgi:hypothetical protein
MAIQNEKFTEYHIYKTQWKTMTRRQLNNFKRFREHTASISRDVQRTDRCVEFYRSDQSPNLAKLGDILVTYLMFNIDLGYYQVFYFILKFTFLFKFVENSLIRE